MVKPELFGSPKDYPSLIYLASKLNDLDSRYSKLCANMVGEYIVLLNSTNVFSNKKDRNYFMELIKEDFKKRILVLPIEIQNEMKNYIMGLYRNKYRTFCRYNKMYNSKWS